MPDDAKTFQIEDVQIIFRNFAGEKSTFNQNGDRTFAVVLDEKLAKTMADDGWNVKLLESREEGEPGTPYIQVTVGYKNRPPYIVLISGDDNRTHLTEDIVGMLDGIDIKTADLICRGYDWDVNGKKGTKAYLKTLFVTLEEDDLMRKYGVGADG